MFDATPIDRCGRRDRTTASSRLRGNLEGSAEPTLRLLVLGGTVFLGRHVVAEALAGGAEVTIFTRGRTNPELFPEAEHLAGDRDGGLDSLRGRQWDGVVDTSGYVPRIVEQSAELLRAAVGRYVFVSSISVYAGVGQANDEEAPTAMLADPASEDVGESYGALKAACEGVCERIYAGRSTQVPGGSDRRPARPDRSLHVLVRADRRGR